MRCFMAPTETPRQTKEMMKYWAVKELAPDFMALLTVRDSICDLAGFDLKYAEIFRHKAQLCMVVGRTLGANLCSQRSLFKFLKA